MLTRHMQLTLYKCVFTSFLIVHTPKTNQTKINNRSNVIDRCTELLHKTANSGSKSENKIKKNLLPRTARFLIIAVHLALIKYKTRKLHALLETTAQLN